MKAGQISALELVDAAIALIEALEPEVHALAAVDFEGARNRARELPQGPLGGIPFLVKDLIAYPGLRHPMGSRLFASNVATDPTPYSQRLDAAGLIVLGKTTSGNYGFTVGRSIVYGYVPIAHAKATAFEFEAFGERSSATRIERCAYDPERARILS